MTVGKCKVVGGRAGGDRGRGEHTQGAERKGWGGRFTEGNTGWHRGAASKAT